MAVAPLKTNTTNGKAGTPPLDPGANVFWLGRMKTLPTASPPSKYQKHQKPLNLKNLQAGHRRNPKSLAPTPYSAPPTHVPTWEGKTETDATSGSFCGNGLTEASAFRWHVHLV